LQLFYKPLVWVLACGVLEMCCNVGQGFPSSFCGGRKNKINSSKFAPNFYNCMSFFALLLTVGAMPCAFQLKIKLIVKNMISLQNILNRVSPHTVLAIVGKRLFIQYLKF
jgi:hypothetical protein